MHFIQQIFEFLSDKLKMIGAVCMVGMTALTCVDVVGRFFKHPIFGSVELVTFMGALAIAMALPYTHDTKGHIGVEILIRRFSKKTRIIIDLCTGLISFIFFALVTWRMFDYAIKMKESGEVSMNLQLPEWAIILVVAVCFVVFAGIIIKGLAENIMKMRDK